jgi:LacI family transcriptional regulator
MRAWGAHGVIARIEDQKAAAVIRRLRLPTVDLRGTVRAPQMAGVFTDDRRVVQMAAEHLLSNGLTHLAYCGRPGIDYSAAREQAFNELPLPTGVHKHVYRPLNRRHVVWDPSSFDPDEPGRRELLHWLRALPKPIGIIACNDVRGREILELCAEAHISVPYDVSVVGVDDDDVICQLSFPTLSSVEPNVEMIGFHAAATLDRMISGEAVSPMPMLVAPLCMEVRNSSDATVSKDPIVLSATKLIKSKVAEGISIKQLVAELNVSRSTLERRFHDQMHCSPFDYISRCRVSRAQQLLATTNYSMFQIARMSGFNNTGYMSVAFRAHTGRTPTQYRQENA